MYDLIGKKVSVTLYNKDGIVLRTVSGRVADVSPQKDIGGGMKKDLVFVVGIDDSYVNSAGQKGESWFAVQDCIFHDDIVFLN